MDLADAVKEVGTVAGGGSAIGAGVAWTAAMLASDLGRRVDVGRWMQNGAGAGAVFGLVALIFQAARLR